MVWMACYIPTHAGFIHGVLAEAVQRSVLDGWFLINLCEGMQLVCGRELMLLNFY